MRSPLIRKEFIKKDKACCSSNSLFKDPNDTLNSWSELRDELLKKDDWIFRGVMNYDFDLKTSIDRYFENYSSLLKVNDAIFFERDMISQLNRSIHQYIDNTSTILNSDFQKICFLQHFGAATRLLDFSYSPFIASFFALEWMKEKKDGAIYAIDSTVFEIIQEASFKEIMEKMDKLNEEMDKLNKEDKDLKKRIEGYSKIRTEGIGIATETLDYFLQLSHENKDLKNKINPFVGLVDPYFKFNRLTNQNGCFLIQFDIQNSFQKNLEIAIERANIDKNSLKKYRIKYEWREEALRDLNKMNINNSTLFPDVEGFIKSLNIQTDISVQIQKERGYIS